jgi:transposase-like protein
MKNKEGKFPETLHEAIRYFADEDHALEFMKTIRWPDGVVRCPRCHHKDVSFVSTRRIWKCKHCATNKQFSIKVGTVMEDSPISLDKWLCAFWLIANAKNGISSYELHRSLGVTQKTAWFLLHRIRLAMQDGSFVTFKGQVEADETYIGAKARYMHKDRRTKEGNPATAKTPIQGVLERTTEDKLSRVKLRVLKTTRKTELQSMVREIVEKGSEVMTDSWRSYQGLDDTYVHQVVDHLEAYAKGHVHTNGLENFWSLFKRALKGTYVNVEPFHLFRYCDEQAFRFNERKENDAGRFVKAVAGYVGKGLKYAKLIGVEDGGGLPPETTETWQAA